MIIAILIAMSVVSGMSLIFGAILGYSSYRFKVENDAIVEKINACFPQSQCGQCGYTGCLPYAIAISNDNAAINKCTPGGKKVMLKLSTLLNISPQPLDSAVPLFPVQKIAIIDEKKCIGCNKCVKVCPVDAIIGSLHTMHTVLSKFCTGCSLCVSPCPMDCINIFPIITNKIISNNRNN